MKRFLPLILFGGLFLIFSNTVFSQKERYATPVDEGTQDASFKAFRDDLIEAVKQKNKTRLYAAMDKDIQISFGCEQGIEDFKKFWKINDPKTKVWKELLTVLENGGKFTKDVEEKSFCAPYLFMNFPDDLDEFENSAVFGKNVNLRTKPNLTSDVVTSLSYNVVKVDWANSVTSTKDMDDYIWLKINTLGGKTGYVGAEFIRSPIDYRACFVKKGGKWKMTVFVAGDYCEQNNRYKIR